MRGEAGPAGYVRASLRAFINLLHKIRVHGAVLVRRATRAN
jgi:hypothetical protein